MAPRRQPKICNGCGATASSQWHRQRGNKLLCSECQQKKRSAAEDRRLAQTGSSSIESLKSLDLVEFEKIKKDNAANDESSSEKKSYAEEINEINNSEKEDGDAKAQSSKRFFGRNTQCRLTRSSNSNRPIRAVVMKNQALQHLSSTRSSSAERVYSKSTSISSTKSGLAVMRNKNRHYLFKCSKPEKAIAKRATYTTKESLWHKNQLFRYGDVVAVVDEQDERTYYALIRGLLRDEYCQQFAALTWLLPSTFASTDGSFDPSTYVLGPEDETFYSLDSVQFVCHVSTEYFKSRGANVLNGHWQRAQELRSQRPLSGIM